MSKNTTPRWQNPNKPIPPKDADPKAKAKPAGRNYVAEAVAALGVTPTPTKNAEALKMYGSTVSAIIIAQAIDRFAEQLVRAAAVSQYKRTS